MIELYGCIFGSPAVKCGTRIPGNEDIRECYCKYIVLITYNVIIKDGITFLRILPTVNVCVIINQIESNCVDVL